MQTSIAYKFQVHYAQLSSTCSSRCLSQGLQSLSGLISAFHPCDRCLRRSRTTFKRCDVPILMCWDMIWRNWFEIRVSAARSVAAITRSTSSIDASVPRRYRHCCKGGDIKRFRARVASMKSALSEGLWVSTVSWASANILNRTEAQYGPTRKGKTALVLWD